VLKEGWGLAGDIATTDPDMPWHFELKNAPSAFKGLHQFFTSEKFSFWKWLKQAQADCPEYKEVMIIFNRFDQPTWCAAPCTPHNDIQNRLEQSGINFMIFFRDVKMKGVIAYSEILYVWKLDDMLNSNPRYWR
jgi:hypothetical protein